MRHTVTIDIINEKAIKLLEDLEVLQLIRLHKENVPTITLWKEHYKGAMTKQPLADIDSQLQQLRNEWE